MFWVAAGASLQPLKTMASSQLTTPCVGSGMQDVKDLSCLRILTLLSPFALKDPIPKEEEPLTSTGVQLGVCVDTNKCIQLEEVILCPLTAFCIQDSVCVAHRKPFLETDQFEFLGGFGVQTWIRVAPCMYCLVKRRWLTETYLALQIHARGTDRSFLNTEGCQQRNTGVYEVGLTGFVSWQMVKTITTVTRLRVTSSFFPAPDDVISVFLSLMSFSDLMSL